MTATARYVPASPARRLLDAKARVGAAKIGFVFATLAVWQVLVVTDRLRFVPSPIDVGLALVDVCASGEVWSPLGTTILAWAISFSLAVGVGVAIGFPLGSSSLAYRMSGLVLDFCRTIPTLALVPLAILLYGTGVESTVLLASFGAVWAVLLQTIYGVRDVDPLARDVFRSCRATRREVLIRLVLPTATPYIATGVRLAAAISLLLTLSAQIIMPAPGLGEQIVVSQLGGAIPQMYAYIALCGLLGVGLNAVFVALERGVLHWHPAHRKEVH